MKIDVVGNAKRNITAGIINKIVILASPFITRTVINYILGAEYLGLDSLFSSILNVLSLSELGFSTAVVYFLYNPIAHNDIETVNRYLGFYRKAYRFIGLAIFILGIAAIPFIPALINGTYPRGLSLTKIYIVYLLNTSISYFMYAYLNALIAALQREDIISRRNIIVKSILTVSQVVLLLLTRKYIYFLILMPIFTIVNNLWTAYVVKKQYPQFRCKGIISKEEFKEIRKLVAGTFIQKACSVTRNSLDSICISTYLGLVLTAKYNNYYQIYYGLTSLMGIFTTSFAGGIGNHVVTRDKDNNFEELKKLDFVYLWIGGWASACLLCLYQPLVSIWMGSEMLLPFSSVMLFCLYFYIGKLGDMRQLYTSACGLWWKHRWRSIIETVSNLVMNIILGKLYGVNGIIIATIISLFACNYIWGARITFDNYFGRHMINRYYKYQFKHFFVTNITIVICYLLCWIIPFDGFLNLLLRIIVCMIIPNLTYCLVYSNTNEYHALLSILPNPIKKVLSFFERRGRC